MGLMRRFLGGFGGRGVGGLTEGLRSNCCGMRVTRRTMHVTCSFSCRLSMSFPLYGIIIAVQTYRRAAIVLTSGET